MFLVPEPNNTPLTGALDLTHSLFLSLTALLSPLAAALAPFSHCPCPRRGTPRAASSGMASVCSDLYCYRCIICGVGEPIALLIGIPLESIAMGTSLL